MRFSLKSAVMSLALAIVPTTALSAVSLVTRGFDGPDLSLNITVGGGFIPPDTMGAVGRTQFATILNGSFGVYDKATGARTMFIDDDVFWRNAGATSFGGAFTNGDPRIMFSKTMNRWVATAFGGDTSFLNIGVSDTADAMGPWKATTFLGFNGISGGGVADYPTLAMDRNAVYVGTNDFDPGFVGSTLHVIPLSDVFNAGAPVVSNKGTFVTRSPFTPDLGYAQQAANSDSASTTGHVVADGILSNGVGFKVTNANQGSGGAAIANQTNLSGQADVIPNGDARQPDGSRTLDALDTRISGGAYELNGKIYFSRTVTRTSDPNYTAIRVTVLNANDFSLAQQFDIDTGDYDYYQGSIAVNAFGAVVNYNRSGFDIATGNVAVMANAYTLDSNGLLVFDATHLLKYSPNNGYSLGSPRNRWGDYSQVTIDPTDPSKFWLIGEYAGFRDTGDTTRDDWQTWIAEISFGRNAVPEPDTWALMIVGFGLVGATMRRSRRRELAIAA